MLSKIKNNQSGFTIVEIMIVMAIIGMMLLAMLLVVPSLRRNARNKQRRDDVGSVISAINEYSTNNSGNLPTAANQFSGEAKLSFYSASDIDYSTTAVTSAPGTDVNTLYVRTGTKCSGNAVTGTGATRRNVAVYFFVETTNSTTAQCQEL
jgi:prepilin-type N-terminal cleavage/methylation domain-containing protein